MSGGCTKLPDDGGGWGRRFWNETWMGKEGRQTWSMGGGGVRKGDPGMDLGMAVNAVRDPVSISHLDVSVSCE